MTVQPWDPTVEPDLPRISAAGWGRVALRALPLIVVLLLGVVLMALLRLIEAPLYGQRRPATPYITVFVCRMAFVILGVRHRIQGAPMAQPGAVVSNHASWLDIFSLNARKRIYFVSKSEVASWPGIGWLARATGTVFESMDGPPHRRRHILRSIDRLHPLCYVLVVLDSREVGLDCNLIEKYPAWQHKYGDVVCVGLGNAPHRVLSTSLRLDCDNTKLLPVARTTNAIRCHDGTAFVSERHRSYAFFCCGFDERIAWITRHELHTFRF